MQICFESRIQLNSRLVDSYSSIIADFYPTFLNNVVRYYFIQQFWIACHLLIKEYKQFKVIIELQDPKNGLDNLEQNKRHDTRIRDIIKYVDDRIKYLVLFFIVVSIIGTLIPIIQIWQLYSRNQLSTKHEIALPVIIIAAVYLLGFSLYKALMIPSEFKNAMDLYFYKVGCTPKRYRQIGFYREVSRHLFELH
jgi:hypothetical protein